MCLDAPEITQPAQRQESKQAPVSRTASTDDERRRRGMMASILTSSRGVTSALRTTAGNPKLGG